MTLTFAISLLYLYHPVIFCHLHVTISNSECWKGLWTTYAKLIKTEGQRHCDSKQSRQISIRLTLCVASPGSYDISLKLQAHRTLKHASV